jgi:hypothetical protein
LGLRPGDPLDATVDGNRIVLTPCRQHVSKAKIIAHPVSGHPVLSAGEDAPVLTSREVEEFLAEFP